MTRAHWGLLLLAAGCAASAPRSVARPRAGALFAEQEAALQAEEARVAANRAEREHMAGTFKKVSVRSGSLSRQRFDDGDGVDAGIRLELDRPFKVSALAKSLEAEGDAASHTLEAARRAADARTCEESVSGRAETERRSLGETYRAQLTRLLELTRAARGAGTLDPANAARTELSVARKLVEQRPSSSVLRIHPQLGPLPSVEPAPGGALDRDPARLGERIEREHPEVLSHLSRAKGYEQSATAERRSRLPWLDFVQLDLGTTGGAKSLGGRFAIEVPLDDGARARAERELYLSESESYEALSRAITLAREAMAALDELDAFEHGAAEHRAIAEAAQRADELAAKMLDAKAEGPERVAQLVSEAHAARLAVLDARERAGQAACVLAYATGVEYAAWPRK